MTVVRLIVVAAVVAGCGEHSSQSTSNQASSSHGEQAAQSSPSVAIADNVLIVPGQRVGEFVIGQNNATSIWNYKKSRAHDKWNSYAVGLDTPSSPDLQFQLGPGGELDSVLVQSADYETAEGFRVGTLANDIEAALGEPRIRATEQHGGIDVPVLDYGGIVFVIGSDRVTGIWVRA